MTQRFGIPGTAVAGGKLLTPVYKCPRNLICEGLCRPSIELCELTALLAKQISKDSISTRHYTPWYISLGKNTQELLRVVTEHNCAGLFGVDHNGVKTFLARS